MFGVSQNPVGLLLVDKPAGLTSHDVVNRVRRSLQTRRVGHAGTLDPDATGLLVVCVGDATRLLEYLATDGKVYEGEITFGIVTDTDDASGTVLVKSDASHLSESAITSAANKLVGAYLQRVPRYSAVHIDGKRAYELARQGSIDDTQLPMREVVISRLEILGIDFCSFKVRFRVWCSTGTYIRSLCRDWGEMVGVGGHMSGLRRLASGLFNVEDAVLLDTFVESETPRQYLRPLEDAVAHLPPVRLEEHSLKRLCQGQTIDAGIPSDFGEFAKAESCRVLDETGRFYAIGALSHHSKGMTVRPKKVLRNWELKSGR